MTIEFHATEPPEGVITAPAWPVSIGFEGWLGLLAELQSIAASPEWHHTGGDSEDHEARSNAIERDVGTR